MHQKQTVKVNDFALKLANVNGTGSASANGLLMQAIFRMGIPVSGKNLFPSNIQGLPTWFTIRASKEGFIARRREENQGAERRESRKPHGTNLPGADSNRRPSAARRTRLVSFGPRGS